MLLAAPIVLAGFFDPADNGFDIGDVVPITIVGAIILGLLGWLMEVRIRSIVSREVGHLRAEFRERTDGNGGHSQADIAESLAIIAEHQGLNVPVKKRSDH